MARRCFPLALALALVSPLVVVGLAGASPSGQAQAPQAQDWTLEPRLLPEQGFEVTSEGTVDGEPAVIERRFDLDEAELTIRYRLGDADDPERHVEAHLQLTGVYVFEDDGDGELRSADLIVDHRRVDPDAEAFVTPVRSTAPLSTTQAVVPLEDGGRIAVTLTASDTVAMVRGDQLAPSQTRMNVTAEGLSTTGDHHVAVAVDAGAQALHEAEDALVRLDGAGAGVSLAHLGVIEGEASASSVFADGTGESGQALVLLSGPQQPTNAHDVQADVVHTSTGLAEVSGAIRGEAGPYLLGFLAASALVGTAAWRKLRSG